MDAQVGQIECESTGKGKYNYIDEVVCGKRGNVIACLQDKCWDRDIDGRQKEVDFKQW